MRDSERRISRLVNPGMGYGSINTARRTIKGYEVMNMIRKGQILGVGKGAVTERVLSIATIFGVAA